MCNGTVGFNLTKHDVRGRLIINVEFGINGGLHLKLRPGYRGYEKLRDVYILKDDVNNICKQATLNAVMP